MKDSDTTSNRLFFADAIRFVAILGAIGIHLLYPVYSRPDFLGGTTWWIANALSAFARSSIPMFIMLSGYLLLPKKESFPRILSRVIFRIVIPLLAWFVFYGLWEGHFLSKPHPVPEMLQMLILSNMFHLYFLVIMVGLYLLLPVFRLAYSRWSVSSLTKAAVVFMCVGVLMYWLQYFVIPGQTLFNSFTLWIPYAGYFLLGGVFAQKTLAPKTAVTLFGVGYLATLALGYISLDMLGKEVRTFWQGSGTSYFDVFLSPNVVLLSVGLFSLLVTGTFTKVPDLAKTAVSQIAKSAFGMYLIHVCVLNILDLRYDYAIELLNKPLLQYLLERSVLALSISFAVTFVAVRIPGIKAFFGEK